MFGERLVGAFGELKAVFDPDNRMNPGKVVHPARLDEHLRLGADWAPTARDLFFSYPDDGGSFVHAANRCVGVGKCRQHAHPGGAVMCPSYQVTGEEEHSTRGSARLLFEMLNGHGDSPVPTAGGQRRSATRLTCAWPARAARPTARPTSTWPPTRPSSSPSTTGRPWRRPRSDLALGWLPALAVAVSRLRLAGWSTQSPTPRAGPGRRVRRRHRAARGAGLCQARACSAGTPAGARAAARGTVLLWPDTFTNYFHPHVGQAAVQVLEEAGWASTFRPSRCAAA